MEMKLREEKGKGGFGDSVPARSCSHTNSKLNLEH